MVEFFNPLFSELHVTLHEHLAGIVARVVTNEIGRAPPMELVDHTCEP
jgi:hypothetical protein